VYAGSAARPMGHISSSFSIESMIALRILNDIFVTIFGDLNINPFSRITENIRPPKKSIFCYRTGCFDPSARVDQVVELPKSGYFN
jgi:hypothetical protein